jgi:hypothetical protein
VVGTKGHFCATSTYKLFSKIYGTLYSTSNLYFQQLYTVQKNVLEYAQSHNPLMSGMASKMKVKYDNVGGTLRK